MRKFQLPMAIVVLALAFQAAAQDMSPLRFEARWRLHASASAFESSDVREVPTTPFGPLAPARRAEVSLTTAGRESSYEGKCGAVGKQSRGEVRASAVLQPTPLGFELLLATEVRANGGYFTMSKQVSTPLAGAICIGGIGRDTPAVAEGLAEVEVRIHLGEEKADYWLDLKFESQSKEGSRTIRLLAPDGTEHKPVSGEPFLLRAGRGTTHTLRASFSDTASDSGRCCGKEQKAALRLVASVRPVTTLLQQGRAPGQLDFNNQFASVGLLATRNGKGQPVPICIASVIGRRTLITAAHCLSRLGIGSPVNAGQVYFLQSPDFRKSLGRVREVTKWEIPIEYVETASGRSKDPGGRNGADLAVVYVNADLDASVSLGPEDPIRSAVDALLVNYGPPSSDAPLDTETLTWARSVVAVTVQGEGDDLLRVMTADGRCGTEAGSPVFVQGAKGMFLAGILVGGSGDCSSKVGPRLDRHLSWIRQQIK